MLEKKYQDRDILNKFGICKGHCIAFAGDIQQFDQDLLHRVIERTRLPLATEDEIPDIVLAVVDDTTDTIALLKKWRQHLKLNGSIWLLSSKRDQPHYVNQRELIVAGRQAGVVDNKICSVSPTISAMRFVNRKKDQSLY
jgi:hypothetical protein